MAETSDLHSQLPFHHDEVDLLIHSSDRIIGDHHDFRIRIHDAFIHSHPNDSFATALDEISFMHSNYPVNTYYNTLKFIEDTAGIEYTATLTPGNYTATELAAEIKTAMEVPSGLTYTVSYNAITERMSITTTDPFKFLAVDNDAYRVLGFSTLSATSALTQTGDSLVDVSGSTFIDVVTNIPTRNISSGSLKVTERIPLTVSYGEFFYWKAPEKSFRKHDLRPLSHLEIALKDDQGNPFLLDPTTPLSVKFKIAKSV
jgi:hypothetical protein